MGFFGKVFGGAVKIKDEAMAEVSKLKRQDDILAMLSVIALVSGSDGEVSKEESDMAVAFVKTGNVFKGFDRTMLANTLDENFKKSVNPILREDLLDSLRDIADEPDTALKVIKAGIAMAGADNSFEQCEKDVLIEACKAANVNPSQFKQLS